ncbi:MAG: hypothetical protein WD512_04425 [Candidatus Paceibacterota bacterium]
MDKYLRKFISFLLNNNLFFVEVIALALPAFILNNDNLDIPSLIKNILYIYCSLIALRLLLPAIYKAYEPNSKLVKVKAWLKVIYLGKIILLSIILMASTKLLHNYLSPHTFSLLLITLFLKVLLIKSKIEHFTFAKCLIIKFCYLFSLSFLSLLVYADLLITPALLISFNLTCLLTGYSLANLYLESPKKPTTKQLRIPGIFYLSHIGLQGLHILLALVAPWKFIVFFFIPLIVKLTPPPLGQPTPIELERYSKFNLLVFVIFLGIMLI